MWNEFSQVRNKLGLLTLLLTLLAGPACGESLDPITPGSKDHCPVCGMFTAPYPESVAQIIFTDGSYFTFDGPKDFFKYYFFPRRYVQEETSREIGAIFVMDYYGVNPIDAREAWFVIGSDVLGPMGKDLVPFTNEDDARGFIQDHQGRALKFAEISAQTLTEFD